MSPWSQFVTIKKELFPTSISSLLLPVKIKANNFYILILYSSTLSSVHIKSMCFLNLLLFKLSNHINRIKIIVAIIFSSSWISFTLLHITNILHNLEQHCRGLHNCNLHKKLKIQAKIWIIRCKLKVKWFDNIIA